MTRSLILGTAGHIDHGKTELVEALTGVDTDRLAEEKARGITIDLGFAELRGEDVQLGVVDVPGHEGFIRNMLAGATGMDVVLLVVAADEGVMPQTREHLAILRLLRVRRVVVALTKADLVEEEWLELVREEVRELLEDAGLPGVPMVPTSTRTGRGLDELTGTLLRVASTGEDDESADLARLPVDRAFTVKGTGTVVTGTLWSGTLRTGEQVRLLPDGPAARIRGLQVHGADVDVARAGQRTAVALAGAGVDLETVVRGQTLVADRAWPPSSMLTLRAEVLPDTAWILEPGQRVRVHLGTAEVMARAVLLDREAPLLPGEEGWVQLRLEGPAVARVGERVVVRSYSPMTTIGGGTVVEAPAPKRTRLSAEETRRLDAIHGGSPPEVLEAALEAAGQGGVRRELLPLVTGLSPDRVRSLVDDVLAAGGLDVQGIVLSPGVVARTRDQVLAAVDRHHADEPLRPGLAVEALRAGLPADAAPGLTDATVAAEVLDGVLEVRRGLVSRRGFEPRLDPDQERVRSSLAEAYRTAGFAPPALDELPHDVRGRPDLWPILRLLEDDGTLTLLEEGLFIHAEVAREGGAAIRDALGGREGLGPADFREVLPVTRKYLLPLLAYFDRTGVTVRRSGGRDVPVSG